MNQEATAQTISADDWRMQLKKYGYIIVLIPAILFPITFFFWEATGSQHDIWWYFPIFVVFGIIPLFDHLIGKDPFNPNEEVDVPRMALEKWYPFLTIMTLPVMAATIAYGAALFSSAEVGIFGKIGMVISMGVIGGIVCINVGHELIHKDSTLEQWTGGLLLALVTYAGFKVEHIRGHHVHVSTPEDASSSRYNQTLYQFLPHAYFHNFMNAWKLEAKKLARKNLPALHWKNELIWWYSISFLTMVVFAAVWGWMGAVFFIAQSFFAFTLLEIVNYIEHYGLHRRKLENGRYERTTPAHSWNSNFLLTNLFLVQLQRHSDHHANPKRRYQVLRHFDESPQLPSGYAGMVVLAVIPSLWFKVMNPRVEAYYKGEEHQLTAEQKG
ncbi:MAG: alkane 1-monooxygenase [Thalassolituus sp.]|jgi:alkane 1-monooxygenase|uniref:alkane 1-monooxygenase n=2 Tax=Oceanospirillales TaxID=135619 RepID=UPI00243F0242|nr:alkane 1-monooxygenase [Pseudomonadota bacterium]MEC8523708.1 alkane 1-monooxygenase [Pseudomonadota bacterium]TNC86607.1 MAG: alkane 1-monooxygenase [Thalassolituus sp.]